MDATSLRIERFEYPKTNKLGLTIFTPDRFSCKISIGVLQIIVTRAAISLSLGPREHSEHSESRLSCYTTVKWRKSASIRYRS